MHGHMEVSVTGPGESAMTIEVDEGTYGELIEAVGLSPMEAAVLVDGQPVPADAPIAADEVTVLRLIHGG